ncbi:2889_t:CDS:1 [Paraglomus brasilianum]|uniref:2889_t:CDS:1 n=1 Tax=Paraglomus brasilianum TaxID=144538 RepID=A0A9N9B971_9GLOM|nr:2889_t:CDS:1 [Paraglomus brasilianum]
MLVAEEDEDNGAQYSEYFIDRDGVLFRYIIQFYRTKRILFRERDITPGGHTITAEELEAEFQYYRLPFALESQSLSDQHISTSSIEKAVAEKLDQFVLTFKKVLVEVFSSFELKISITFYRKKSPPYVQIGIGSKRKHIFDVVNKMVSPLRDVGYSFLDSYNPIIATAIRNEIPNIKWTIEDSHHNEDGEGYRVSVIYEGRYDMHRIRDLSNLPDNFNIR